MPDNPQDWFTTLRRCARALDTSPLRFWLSLDAADLLRRHGVSPYSAAAILWARPSAAV